MKSKLESRLKELKQEYQKGQERLVALDQETTNLGNTMLRISGAIQVISEILGDVPSTSFKPSDNGIEIAQGPN